MNSNISQNLSPVNLCRICWGLLALHLLPLSFLLMKTNPWMTGDSGRYLALAESLLLGRGFGFENEGSMEPEGWRMPGYPLFIAVCRFVAGGSYLGVVVGQSALFLISVWLVWKIATRTFGELTGLFFLLLSTIYPFVAYSAGQISAEMPVVFLISMVFFLLLEPSLWRVALAALLIGSSAYFRPNLMILTLAIAAAITLADRRNYQKALLMLGIATIVAVPWAIRNYSVFGTFTPMPVFKGTGTSLLLATWQSKISAPSLIKYGMRGEVTPEVAMSGMIEQIRVLNRQIGVPENTVFVTLESYPNNQQKMKAEIVLTHAALSNIRSWPITYLRSSAINTVRMWFSANLPEDIPSWIRFGLRAEGVLIFLLGLGGVGKAVLRTSNAQKLMVFCCAALFLYFSLTLCWLHTEARYTIPARLLFLMFAAYFVAFLLKSFGSHCHLSKEQKKLSNRAATTEPSSE